MTKPYIGRLRIGITAMLCCIAFYFLVPGFFAGVEEGLLPWKYRIRGEAEIDTSIMVIALGSDDLNALGGLPLKRSYYALLLSALDDLGADVVGLDLGLSDAGASAPEYDDLLASVMRGYGNVVLGGYFRSLAPATTVESRDGDDGIPERFGHAVGGEEPWPVGHHFTLPYAAFTAAAAGLGHTNLTENLTLPLYVRTGSGHLPLFSLEVLRRGMKGDDFRVRTEEGTLLLKNGEKSYAIPYGAQGDVSLNFTGGIGSLRIVSFLDFLRRYDKMKMTGKPDLSVGGKMVLLGVVAEGRSAFVESPFGSQFPALGLHALFLDNAMHGDFLRGAPPLGTALIMVALGIVAALSIAPGRITRGVMVVIAWLLLYTVLSFLLFSTASYLLPLFACWFAGLVAMLVLLVYNQRVTESHLDTMATEKTRVAALLERNETKMEHLRRELETENRKGREAENKQLIDEIEKYKSEVLKLRRLEEDLIPAEDFAGRGDAGRTPGAGGDAKSPGPGDGSRTAGTDRETTAGPAEFFGILYDRSGALGPVVDLIRKVSTSDATVLITGESGSGKEMVARAIHESSTRKGMPFVAVNCGALTETLLESELFGHEKGAFTGAVREKPGRFEVAGTGTIFLDEIGETSESFQVKLLRVLQDGTFERVGGTDTLQSGARVITATNRDLKTAVEEKSFRADLYYRLNVLTVDVPPLRERSADIPVLAQRFLDEQGPGFILSESVMQALRRYAWRGNVRELQSAIIRAALLAQSDGRSLIRLKDLSPEVAETLQASEDIEELIVRSLREKNFSRSAISETADEIGGFNRGTIAEYFRGFCFDAFRQAGFDEKSAVVIISGSEDAGINEKVAKKLSGYLMNAAEFVDRKEKLAKVLERSRPKYKNLPGRYHRSLDTILTAAHEGKWGSC